jgi:sortase (surface protein transpeptidase)
MKISSVESLSILVAASESDYSLELIRAFGPGTLPLAAVALYTIAVNGQIGIIERTTRNEIKATQESTEKQIKASQESTEKQIKASQESTENQINAMNKLNEERIKASEAKIENILMKFVVQKNNRGDDGKK